MAADQNIEALLAAVTNPKRQADARELLNIMREVTGAEPVLWGNIIGFGKNHYK